MRAWRSSAAWATTCRCRSCRSSRRASRRIAAGTPSRATLALGVARHLLADALLLLAQLRREFRAEILGLEHLPDLDLRFRAGKRVGAALHPVDGFVQGLHLQHPEPREGIPGERERPLRHAALGAGELHARALRGRLKPFAGE